MDCPRFAALRNADPAVIEGFGVCLSCGAPWGLHGRPRYEDWNLVDEPDDAPLHRARTIVAATAAEQIGKLSIGGRLCVRCLKIGRVRSDGVCSFCIDEE